MMIAAATTTATTAVMTVTTTAAATTTATRPIDEHQQPECCSLARLVLPTESRGTLRARTSLLNEASGCSLAGEARARRGAVAPLPPRDFPLLIPRARVHNRGHAPFGTNVREADVRGCIDHGRCRRATGREPRHLY